MNFLFRLSKRPFLGYSGFLTSKFFSYFKFTLTTLIILALIILLIFFEALYLQRLSVPLDTHSEVIIQYYSDHSKIFPIHSHNDYWREKPLFTALNNGIMSVEADVWCLSSTSSPDPMLYVNHNKHGFKANRNLEYMYLVPLYELLTMRNNNTNETVGVFASQPHQTLYLLIDFKTDGDSTYDAVYNSLEILRSKGWLTTYDKEEKKMEYRPVTVIGTGNTPLNRVLEAEKRDIFFDAPLGSLDDRFTVSVSPLASGSLKKLLKPFGSSLRNGKFNTDQEKLLKDIINDAHRRGLKARLWDTADTPAVWEQLHWMGSDIINTNDLKTASWFYNKFLE